MDRVSVKSYNGSMFAFSNLLLKPGPATSLLEPFAIRTFHEAILWVWRLPYSRNSDRSNYMLVPIEQKGACSAKHAFLAQVAAEQSIPLNLCIGIFMMNGENTPGIGNVLEESGLISIPEAHCYLKYKDERYDFTLYEDSTLLPNFLYEEIISPNQIGDYKIKLHQQWLKNWSQKTNQTLQFTELWLLREKCIQALS